MIKSIQGASNKPSSYLKIFESILQWLLINGLYNTTQNFHIQDTKQRNGKYHLSIQMVPFEVLYGRQCQSIIDLFKSLEATP